MIVVNWKKGRFPPNWSIIFGRDRELVLDVGCGNGDFLMDFAGKYDYNFIGIEISKEFIRKAEKKIERRGLKNVRLIECDAYFALSCLFMNKSVKDVYFNFPDPWDRESDMNKRLLTYEFLRILTVKMKEGGTVTVLTDHEGFRDFILENFKKINSFTSALDGLYTDVLPYGYPYTNYRRKWEGEGKRIYYMKFILTSPPSDGYTCPIRVRFRFNNLEVGGRYSIETSLLSLKDLFYRDEHLILNVEKVYRRYDDRELLVNLVVKEGYLLQRLTLRVYFSHKKVSIILENMDDVLFTDGVRKAMEIVAGCID